MEFYINRFKDAEKVEYQCEVVTPMFLGGANKNSAELRVPSIKGALRFWWRAVYGGGFNSIVEMAKKEAEIFGSTDPIYGQKSNLIISIIENNLAKKNSQKISNSNFNILEYLAYGYRAREDIKNHIDSGKFTIHMKINNNNLEEIKKTFSFLINLGGLGAKSRNGFGNLYCKELCENFDFNSYKNDLKNIDLKDYSSLSKESKLFIDKIEHNNWRDAISSIEEAYKQAKYHIKINNMSRELIAKPFKRDFSRHAKPYFLHINKLPNGKYKGQILFMPYKYSPNNNFNQNTFNEYLTVCDEMNKKIEQLLNGGAK